MRKYIYILFFFLIFSACSSKQAKGYYEIYYKDFTVEKGNYNNNLKDGIVEIEKNGIKEQFTYSQGIKNGEYKRYEDGELVELATYNNGYKNGYTEWKQDEYMIKGDLVGDGYKHGIYKIFKNNVEIGYIHYFLDTQRSIYFNSYKYKNEFGIKEKSLTHKGLRQGNYTQEYKDEYIEYGTYLDDKKNGKVIRDYIGRIDIENYENGVLTGKFSFDFNGYRGNGVFENNKTQGKYNEYDSYSNKLTEFLFENDNLLNGKKIVHFDEKVKYIVSYENFIKKKMDVYTLKNKHIESKKSEIFEENIFDVNENEIESFVYTPTGKSKQIEYIKDGKKID